MQGGFVNGVKVKKVEERDSVLGSVGGAREQTQTQTRPPSRPRDGNWDLDSDGSAQTACLLSSRSLLLQHLRWPVTGMNPMNWGRGRQLARVWQSYLDALASPPASVHFKCQITVQPSTACHLTC